MTQLVSFSSAAGKKSRQLQTHCWLKVRLFAKLERSLWWASFPRFCCVLATVQGRALGCAFLSCSLNSSAKSSNLGLRLILMLQVAVVVAKVALFLCAGSHKWFMWFLKLNHECFSLSKLHCNLDDWIWTASVVKHLFVIKYLFICLSFYKCIFTSDM